MVEHQRFVPRPVAGFVQAGIGLIVLQAHRLPVMPGNDAV